VIISERREGMMIITRKKMPRSHQMRDHLLRRGGIVMGRMGVGGLPEPESVGSECLFLGVDIFIAPYLSGAIRLLFTARTPRPAKVAKNFVVLNHKGAKDTKSTKFIIGTRCTLYV
jgi:hypothetical protein